MALQNLPFILNLTVVNAAVGSVQDTLKYLEHLYQLDISCHYCELVQFLELRGKQLKSLTYMSGETDTSIVNLLELNQYCPNIKQLDIYCNGFVCESEGELFKNIETLYIDSWNMEPELNNVWFINFLVSLPELKRLFIGEVLSTFITSNWMNAAIAKGCFNNIQIFSLASSPQLNIEDIKNIIFSGPCLTQLNSGVMHLNQITQEEFQELITQLQEQNINVTLLSCS